MKLELLSILIIIVAVPFAFGQLTNDSIVVTTDKTSYSEGETIVITGEVRDLYSGTPVSVIVKAPNGNLVSIISLEINIDKKFNTEIEAGGALMKSEGVYTITAQYGTANRSDSTTFEFEGDTAIHEPTNTEHYLLATTNLSSYTRDDPILVVGSTSNILTDVIFRVTSPSGNNVVAIGQISPDIDGEFSYELHIGQVWEEDGVYKIILSQSSQNTLEIVTIPVIVTDDSISIPHPTTQAEPPHPKIDELKQEIKNLKSKNMEVKLENRQLKFKINDLQTQIDELNLKVINLQNIINEQIKVILQTIQELSNK